MIGLILYQSAKDQGRATAQTLQEFDSLWSKGGFSGDFLIRYSEESSDSAQDPHPTLIRLMQLALLVGCVRRSNPDSINP